MGADSATAKLGSQHELSLGVIAAEGEVATLSAMWETVGKVALLVFLAVALLVLVVFIRKARANGIPESQRPSMFGPFAGAVPPNPLPDWANRDDDPESDQAFPNR